MENYPGAFSFGNMFHIDQIGNADMTLKFDRQETLDNGIRFSLAAWVFLLTLSAVSVKK